MLNVFFKFSSVNSSNTTDTLTAEKPPYSYVALIARAIEVNICFAVGISHSFFYHSNKNAIIFFSIHHNVVQHSTKFIRISHQISRITRKIKKVGKIPFGTILAWTSALWRWHAMAVANAKAIIGRSAAVCFHILLSFLFEAIWSLCEFVALQRSIYGRFEKEFNCIFFFLNYCQSIIDAHYEEMFENGNFRRRRRMKRTYNQRSSVTAIPRLYDSQYVNANYSSPRVIPNRFHPYSYSYDSS